MFPLSGKDFPENTDQLVAGIRDALADVLKFPKKSDPVTVSGDNFPAIKRIKVDLSGAEVSIKEPPPQPKPKGKRQPGITVDQLEVMADPICYAKSKANFNLNARGLKFDFAHDQRGNAMLVLSDATDGHVEVKISKSDLQALLMSAASTAAKQQGAAIQDLEVNLESDGPRSIAADVRVKAKKLVVSGIVNIKGKVDVDDNMVATLSNLSCTGEGMIGGVVAKFLEGKLQSYNGKSIPLMAFSLGDVAIRDLKISTRGAVQVSAEFGRSSK
jgi:hypothetical protein